MQTLLQYINYQLNRKLWSSVEDWWWLGDVMKWYRWPRDKRITFFSEGQQTTSSIDRNIDVLVSSLHCLVFLFSILVFIVLMMSNEKFDRFIFTECLVEYEAFAFVQWMNEFSLGKKWEVVDSFRYIAEWSKYLKCTSKSISDRFV